MSHAETIQYYIVCVRVCMSLIIRVYESMCVFVCTCVRATTAHRLQMTLLDRSSIFRCEFPWTKSAILYDKGFVILERLTCWFLDRLHNCDQI